MPVDKSGKFHLNTQRAMAADKFAANKHEQSKPTPGEPDGNTHADKEEDGDVKTHLASLHAAHGGKHMHIHDDGMGGITSHHVDEDGEVQGPHNHENLEALKNHMDQFLDEEGHEGQSSDDDSDSEEPDYHNLSGI